MTTPTTPAPHPVDRLMPPLLDIADALMDIALTLRLAHPQPKPEPDSPEFFGDERFGDIIEA